MPTLFKSWPESTGPHKPEKIVQMYMDGFIGAKAATQEQIDALKNEIKSKEYGVVSASSAAHQYGWADSHAGQLVTPFAFVEKAYPGCWPGAAQEVGDCVSHSGKNARLVSLVCEVLFGKPDEVSGKLERLPEVSPEGIKNGVLSTEAHYWFRGSNGDGWECASDTRVAIKYSGCVVRQAYPDLGIDLTEYSGSLAHKYGGRQPPENIQNELKQHLIRTATEANSFEEVRDLLGNGYGITSCGGEGWSSSRDKNGFSRRQGGWSHALAMIGADDRDVIKKEYGEPLVLIINSWGKWNDGGRRILGTDIDIPVGSFWAKWSDCKNRSMFAFSAINGWPRKTLPPFVTGIF